MSRIVRFKKKRVFLSKDVAWYIIGAVHTHAQHALLQHTHKQIQTHRIIRAVLHNMISGGDIIKKRRRAREITIFNFYFFYFLKSNETLVLFIPLTSLRANLLFLFFFFFFRFNG